jgi:thioredoxin-dependent peroxiredoxin
MIRWCLALVLLGSALAGFGCQQRASGAPLKESPMLLAVGAKTPELTGTDQRGVTHRLADSAGHPLLVYFYPKDATPGCTKEACAFRDVWKRFEEQGVALYGVSRDDQASHAKFAENYQLPFPLIADPTGAWERAFGVPERNGKSSRVSFLFDARGRLARVYPKVDPGVHADEVLADVAELEGKKH